MESPTTIIKNCIKYDNEARIKALATLDDLKVELPMPELPKYEPKPKEKWSATAIRSFAHGLLP